MREAAALADKERLEEIQRQMAEQAKIDRERVKYREEKLQEQKQARKMAEEQAKEAEREKEMRLDKLREQVQPHVESDPGIKSTNSLTHFQFIFILIFSLKFL